MKKTYLIPILVVVAVGLIVLRPERQAAPTTPPKDTATEVASTPPENPVRSDLTGSSGGMHVDGDASVPSDNTTTSDVPSSAEEPS
ncbi:MAG: hypothetical protein U1D26_01110, partial [Patescibacteria group bacterium]|nr:hypothetical protein [Patescibacteria group bacterium]